MALKKLEKSANSGVGLPRNTLQMQTTLGFSVSLPWSTLCTSILLPQHVHMHHVSVCVLVSLQLCCQCYLVVRI